MPKVVVVVESGGREISEQRVAGVPPVVATANPKGESSTLRQMLSALESAIASYAIQATSVEVVAVNKLTSLLRSDRFQPQHLQAESPLEEIIFCPLTLSLPESVKYPSHDLIIACRDIFALRQRLTQQMQVAIGDGCFWLPVVLTNKGPLYGEVIALAEEFAGEKLPFDLLLLDLTYYQPFHLSDALRQPLYQMAHNLLQSLSAPPATYLVQFGFLGSEICFDRLWPFPTAPALASVGVQQPDLFTCHWHCLAAKPLLDLTIIPVAK